MKRLFSLALFGAAALLAGCPVYSDGSNGYHRVCSGGACYSCPDGSGNSSASCSPWSCGGNTDCPYGYQCDVYTSSCVGSGQPNWDSGTTTVPSSCSQPSDCPTGYTCAAGGVCELGNCSVTGCLPGYVCELQNGTIACVAPGTPVDAGLPHDAGTTDSGVGCQSNADCAQTPGALCLDGTCVPPANQCYDGTQCPAGDKCVQGACTPSCQVTTDGGPATSCPTGYACTNVDDASSSGVCSGNPTPCESNPSVCPVGTVCSQNHCVSSCGAGGTCPTGQECIQGGCVPNQNPQFTCTTDGVQDACASGSVCIHHSCYIACNPDAGASACQSAAQFNECKSVTASGGTYHVCGSSTNLGGQCGPSQSCASSAAVCIDGFCH